MKETVEQFLASGGQIQHIQRKTLDDIKKEMPSLGLKGLVNKHAKINFRARNMLSRRIENKKEII